MKNKAHKSGKKNEIRRMAQEIAAQGALYASLAYCMDHRTIFSGTLHHESWFQRHYGWVLALSRESALIAIVRDYELKGYVWVRLSALETVQPEPHLTEQWALLSREVPPIQDVEGTDLSTMLFTLAHEECMVRIFTLRETEKDSRDLTGRVEKIGKKRLTFRSLDMDDLAWRSVPDKVPYDEIDLIVFQTPSLHVRESLAMGYDAYLRSINESLEVPEDMEDMDGGQDIRYRASEDMVDLEDLVDTVDTDEESDNGEDIRES